MYCNTLNSFCDVTMILLRSQSISYINVNVVAVLVTVKPDSTLNVDLK